MSWTPYSMALRPQSDGESCHFFLVEVILPQVENSLFKIKIRRRSTLASLQYSRRRSAWMRKRGKATQGVVALTTRVATTDSGPRRWPKACCGPGQITRLLRGVWLGLLMATCAGSALAGVVPQAPDCKAGKKGSALVLVQFRVNTLPEGQLGGAEQPAPAPGPGPISPGSGPQTPPEALPPPEKGTEAPIGRLEGYEEEKRKAVEIPFRGRPPGAVQEDPAVRRGAFEPKPCEER